MVNFLVIDVNVTPSRCSVGFSDRYHLPVIDDDHAFRSHAPLRKNQGDFRIISVEFSKLTNSKDYLRSYFDHVRGV